MLDFQRRKRGVSVSVGVAAVVVRHLRTSARFGTVGFRLGLSFEAAFE